MRVGACSGRVSSRKRSRQSDEIDLLHQEEQEEIVQAVNFEIKRQATSLAEVQLRVVQQICATCRNAA